MKKTPLILLSIFPCLVSGLVFAQSPRTPINITIPVQGFLTDANGAPLQNTQVSIQFRLYATQVVASSFWEDTYTVRVGNLFPGVFSLSLGSGTNALTDEQLRTNNTPYLGMRIGNDNEMPRWAIQRTPFAAFSNLSGDSAGESGIPIGAIVWSENDHDQRLTGAGFTRMPYTIQADCDQGVNCGGTEGGASAPAWDKAVISSLMNSTRSFIWGNGAAVKDGTCGEGQFYVYSAMNTPARYCPETNTWSDFKSVPGEASWRYAYAAASLKHSDGNHYFHVVGGSGPTRDHNIYNPRSNSWVVGPNYPHSRYGLRGVVYHNEWYVFGGSSDDSNGSAVSTAYKYDPILEDWSALPNIASGTRVEHLVAEIGGKIYIIAGKVNGSRSARVDVYDPATGRYSRAADFSRAVLAPQGEGLGGRIVVHGGSGSDGSATGCGPCYNDYHSYDPTLDTWTNHGTGGSRSAGGTAFAASARLGDCVYVAGGEPWQRRIDRICVPNARAYDDSFDHPAVVLRAYRAP